MDEEDVRCIHIHTVEVLYTGVLFSHKREENPVICDNMDGP